MDLRRILGFALIVLGLVALLWGGISWTERKTIVDAGPLQVQADERKTLPLPPILGGVALVAGVLLVLVPTRTRS